jgi:amino acid transporter
MGYFDALTSAAFKTNAAGQKLFYPYGHLGRGYLIPSETQYERLRRSYKKIWILTLILVVSTVLVTSILSSTSEASILALVFVLITFLFIAFLFAFIIGYIVWARVQCRGLQRSTEKLKYTEALSNETHHLSPKLLWLLEVVSILLVLYGVFLLIEDPSQWLFSVILIAFFATIAVIYAKMIRTKREIQDKPK